MDKTTSQKILELQQGIEEGDLGAYHTIAWLYDDTLKDYDNAEKYYRLSVTHPNEYTPISIFNLADLLSKTDDTFDREIQFARKKEAIELFERIADDDVDAILRLGVLHRFSDRDKAIMYFERGVERNDSRCMAALGRVLRGKDRNDERALHLTKRAADMGNPRGLDDLAMCYRMGWGVTKDRTKEYELLSSAPYETLSRYGKYNLAWFYELDSRYRDYEKAKEIHDSLIEEHRDEDSMYYLGEYYRAYAGTKDPDKAILYYLLAGKHGCIKGYEKALELVATKQEYADLLNPEEHLDVLQRLSKCYDTRGKTPKSKSLIVRYDYLVEFIKDYMECKSRLLEYDLAPPIEGGRLYLQAKEQFKSDINDLLSTQL